MPPAKHPQLDLSPGTVIHVKGFIGVGGFSAKNKFLIIIGWHSATIVLAFRITSQTVYRDSNLARELVTVPSNSTPCLKKESFIQCFHEVERLKVDELEAACAKGLVSKTGELRSFLTRIREVVEVSDVLSPDDIAHTLVVIDKAL